VRQILEVHTSLHIIQCCLVIVMLVVATTITATTTTTAINMNVNSNNNNSIFKTILAISKFVLVGLESKNNGNNDFNPAV